MLRIYVLMLFGLGSVALCYVNTATWPDHGWLFLSFLGNLLCVLIGFYQAIRTGKLNLDTIIWVFVYMFFIIAPAIQMDTGTLFPNTVTIQSGDVIAANFVLFVWNSLYLLFRTKQSRLRHEREKDHPEEDCNGLEAIHPAVKSVYFLLSLFIVCMTLALFKQNYFLGLADYSSLINDKSLGLLVNITFQGVVLANGLFVFDRWRRLRTSGAAGKLILSLAIIANQLSPFNLSRFYIGFCVILAVYLFYYRKLRSSHFIGIIFMGLLVIFPFLNMFRYGVNGYEMPSLYHLMFDQLTELHFDAFASLVATMKYTALHGYSYGYQLLGVLFFFIPRSMWTGKPISSGEAIGDYISGAYTLNFNNLSNPLPSEFYMNFGWAGILLGAILLAWLVNRLEADIRRNRYVHAIIAGYLFIILRGDLMNAFAYCFGTYFVLVVVPMRVTRLINRQHRQPTRRELSLNEDRTPIQT